MPRSEYVYGKLPQPKSVVFFTSRPLFVKHKAATGSKFLHEPFKYIERSFDCSSNGFGNQVHKALVSERTAQPSIAKGKRESPAPIIDSAGASSFSF
jgi:hypothetical protein